jgi:uncharacterized protein YukE
MTFDAAQYQEVLTKINAGMEYLSEKIAEVARAIEAALANTSLPQTFRDALEWMAHEITDLANQIWQKIKQLLLGAGAPAMFFDYAYRWQDIRGAASGVSGQLKPEAMPAAGSWSGPAATAYTKIIPPQGDAANQISTISKGTSTALNACAAAGVVFYVALGIIIVKLVAALIYAIPFLATGVFTLTGVTLIVEKASVSSAEIIAAVTTLIGVLTAQAATMVDLHGDAVDNSAFPGGHWPRARAAGPYADATVGGGHGH